MAEVRPYTEKLKDPRTDAGMMRLLRRLRLERFTERLPDGRRSYGLRLRWDGRSAKKGADDGRVDIDFLGECAVNGHRWQTINWIGLGTTRICERCGRKVGLSHVDAGGAPHFHDESVQKTQKVAGNE